MSSNQAQPDDHRRVITHPDGESPGLGVRYEPHELPGNRVFVDQLWADGTVEPVTITEEEVVPLIRELAAIKEEIDVRQR